jgi:hypothetical protein
MEMPGLFRFGAGARDSGEISAGFLRDVAPKRFSASFAQGSHMFCATFYLMAEKKNGADNRTRTDDHLHGKQKLYQLSYVRAGRKYSANAGGRSGKKTENAPGVNLLAPFFRI